MVLAMLPCLPSMASPPRHFMTIHGHPWLILGRDDSVLSRHRLLEREGVHGPGRSLIPTRVTLGLCHTSMSQPVPSVNHLLQRCSSRKLLAPSLLASPVSPSAGCYPNPSLRRCGVTAICVRRYPLLTVVGSLVDVCSLWDPSTSHPAASVPFSLSSL